MKKMLANFGGAVLSRGQMKSVSGGLMGNCCANQTKSGCNGVCGDGGGTCTWQDAKPELGLEAGCSCLWKPGE